MNDHRTTPNADPHLAKDSDAESRFWEALRRQLVHVACRERTMAVDRARQAVAIGHPQFVGSAWLALGESLIMVGEKAAAVEALQRAIETAVAGQPIAAALCGLDEGATADVPTRAKTLLGVLLRDAGEIEQAVNILADAARGGNTQAVLALGNTYQKIGEADAARTAYEQVVDHGTDGDVASALLNLGVLADRDGDLDAARVWWLKATGLGDPDISRSAEYNLGLNAKDRRDLTEATRRLGPFVESGGRDGALAAAHLGELCYWLGDREEMTRWYRLALATTDDPELVAEAESRLGESM